MQAGKGPPLSSKRALAAEVGGEVSHPSYVSRSLLAGLPERGIAHRARWKQLGFLAQSFRVLS
jgi:hypothetical protein